MAERGGGSIVNIGSITALIGMANILPYVASKGGVIGFTRALAREVGPQNVRVNTVSPGAFPTGGERIHPDPEGYSRFVLDQQSLKRRGTPDDLANVVAFLASDRASFVTGQMLERLRRLGELVSIIFGSPADREPLRRLDGTRRAGGGRGALHARRRQRARRARGARADGRDRGRGGRRPRARPRRCERARHAGRLDLADGRGRRRGSPTRTAGGRSAPSSAAC